MTERGAVSVTPAAETDAPALAHVRTAAAEALTARFGAGHWSTATSEAAARLGFRHARVLVARDGRTTIGTLRLVTKKPWSIDVAYFTPVPRPLYLLDMAVLPDYQRIGVGEDCSMPRLRWRIRYPRRRFASTPTTRLRAREDSTRVADFVR